MTEAHDFVDHEVEDMRELGVFGSEPLAEHERADHVRDRHVHLEAQVERRAHAPCGLRRPRLRAQVLDELREFPERRVLCTLVAEPEVAQRMQRKAALLYPQRALREQDAYTIIPVQYYEYIFTGTLE